MLLAGDRILTQKTGLHLHLQTSVQVMRFFQDSLGWRLVRGAAST